jgi:hypothetical protein
MLLQYAMKIGLGRRSSVNPNRIEWQYSDLVFSAGISDRSLRNYRNSGELPSTTTFKRLLSVLLAEEGADAKAWELAFIEAWVREGLDINIATSVPQASQMVIPPFLTGCGRRTYAAIFSFWAGVMPPMPMFGRSLL